MRIEKVRIPSRRSGFLFGSLHLPPDERRPTGAVLIVHGFKGFKDWGFFPTIAESLAAGGLVALRFNLSGCGIREEGDRFDDPERFETNTYSQELADISDAWDHLGRVGEAAYGRRLPGGLLGHSRGGATSIVYAAERRDVRALVTWSAIARLDRYGPEAVAAWKRGEAVPIVNARTSQTFHLRSGFWDDIERNRERYDLIARAAEVDADWLIVHGEADETVPVQEATDLLIASRGGRGKEMTRLERVPLTGHTFGATHPFAGSTRALDMALRWTVDWFSKRLAR